MRGKASRAWLFAAVLACLVAGTDAIVSSVSQRIYARGGDARRFDRFGFKAGGTAQFTTTFTEANNNNYDEAPLDVYIIGCPDTVMKASISPATMAFRAPSKLTNDGVKLFPSSRP